MNAPGERSAFAVWCAAVAALAVVAISAVAYLFSPNPPFGFTGELGTTIAGTATIAAFVKSFTDLIDAIGWAGWADRTAFAFSPMGIYAASVPLTKFFGGNAFEAIKALQVVELLLAWLAAAYLYRCLRGKTRWALVAGGIYALLPEQLVWARASVEIGAIFALTPLALGACLMLVRRWSSWALPLCGVVAIVASGWFDSAYALFAGLPIFAFASAAAVDRKRPWLWAAMSAAGLACGFGCIAYVAVPTYMSRGVFAPAFSPSMLFSSNDAHAPFSLGVAWLAVIPASLLAWSLATVWAIWVVRARAFARGEGALLLVGGLCALLSFASDRFTGVAVAVAAVAATSALQRGASSPRWRRYAAWLGTATFVCGIALLFVLRNFFGDPPVEAQLPQTGRAASLQWRTEPGPDWQLGAAPMPYAAFQRDIAQRYAGDGLDGAGLLARANVTTIVDAAGRSVNRRPLPGADGYVRSVGAVCIGGGPGLLDRVAALPELRDAAFFDGAFPCTRAIYLNAAPYNQLLSGRLIETFAGGTLFPKARPVRGYDDRIAATRFFINDPWYRDAIDGDSAEVSGVAVAIGAGDTASTLFQSDAAPYSLALHAVCHAAVRGHVLRDGTFSIPFTCAPRSGFQWLRIRFGKLKPGLHSYRLSIDSADASPPGGWAAALDSVLLLADGQSPKYDYDTAFAFSADRLAGPRWLAAGVYGVSLTGADGGAATGALFVDGVRAGRVVAIPKHGLHRLRWVGAPAGAAVLSFVPLSWRSPPPPVSSAQRTSLRWSLSVTRKKSIVEAAVYPDGYWFLRGTNGISLGGAPCDVVNVCFGYVDPGRYELVHQMPDYVIFGFVVTLGAVLVACFALFYAWRREKTAFEIASIDASWPLTYFTYLGWLAGLVCAISWINWLRLGELGWMLAWQLIAVALLTLAAVVVTAWQSARAPAAASEPRHGLWLLWAAVCGLAACVVTSSALDVADHRVFVVALAALQTCAVIAINPGLSRRMTVWVALSAIVTWSLAAGLSFTHLADRLLNGSPDAGVAAAVFVLGFGFVLYALRDADPAPASTRGVARYAAFGVAFAAFALLALRTDSLGLEWIPLHRSLFADVSDFVRQGHWLLWDVPSLYGFFSILTLALVPAANGTQALYELTALFLVVEGCIVYAILQWGRAGWTARLFAALVPAATIFNDGIARFAVSDRLYPQGGLRFFWIVVLLFVIFLMYAWREHGRRVVALRWLGHGIWLFSLLWSLEAGAWATAVWIPSLVLDAVVAESREGGFWVRALRLLRNVLPVAVLPVVAFKAVDLFYAARLGHGPDWRAFAEYTGLFTSGQVRQIFHVQHLGAGWAILLVLASTGALGIAAIRERRWDLLRLLAAAWLAAWATASYYAVEPLDMYVSLLLPVLVSSASIAIFASMQSLRDRATSLLARYALAPVIIIAIASFLGDPARLAATTLLQSPGRYADVTQDAPPVAGDLALLLFKAGIQPGDAVVFPNGDYWTEPQQGMIQPYSRLPDGRIVAYRSWLPLSPVGPTILYNALSGDRGHAYVERFLNISRTGGWYVTYRRPVHCEDVSPHLHTQRTVGSVNYYATYCAYVP